MNNHTFGQSHCIEVVQGDIFVEKEMRFGLNWGGGGLLTQTIFNAMIFNAGILRFEERGVAVDAEILTQENCDAG